ncbi:hypothetical protein ANN_11095 [Periplaneta americana]|uniref:Uncharacterized protein n=1 Tax=Periplaneta americana TaxID=6978 RepID=A0ABQ8T5C2_PERAM|nr:hypothetical protein ANN_11095 [Periplaneta americana]
MLEMYGADCLDHSNISRWIRFFDEGRCSRSLKLKNLQQIAYAIRLHLTKIFLMVTLVLTPDHVCYVLSPFNTTEQILQQQCLHCEVDRSTVEQWAERVGHQEVQKLSSEICHMLVALPYPAL